jgi:hypothetical protein
VLSAQDVEKEIRRQWAEAQSKGAAHVDIRAGDLHSRLGGENRVPQVCQVMNRLKDAEDPVIDGPPSGLSTRLTIRYILPRGSRNKEELATLPERPLNDVKLPKEPDAVSRGLVHDAYGKAIMRDAAGDAFLDGVPVCSVHFGNDAAGGRIDGVVGNRIAVEVESRTPKQIRGAVLDLLFHPYPCKLLLIIAGHQNDARQAANQCRYILAERVAPENFQVVLLSGNGRDHRVAEDVALVQQALLALGWSSGAISETR